MLPHPLHPAVVHFPLVLVFLVPLFAAGALWAIRRGAAPRRAWAVPITLAAALFVSAAVALRTGQAEQERVESVVSESAVETHEEAAERFLIFSGVLFLVAAAGLARGNLGTSARLLTVAGSLALVAAAVQVGAAGGALVYEHGAAGAYTATLPGTAAPGSTEGGESRGERAGAGERGEEGEGHEGT